MIEARGLLRVNAQDATRPYVMLRVRLRHRLVIGFTHPDQHRCGMDGDRQTKAAFDRLDNTIQAIRLPASVHGNGRV